MLSLFPQLSYSTDSVEGVFTEIYEWGDWDESGFSWSGSQIGITQDYVSFLQAFIEKNQIKSVVDIGCGDWAFSRYINWKGVHYTGIDVVKKVVDRNQALFGEENITFIHGDFLNMEWPEADLLLCKDVFQHLSNHEILQAIQQFKKFKHCLITNNTHPVSLSSRNEDITTGKTRPVDLTKPPFNVKGDKVLNFVAVTPKQTLHICRLKTEFESSCETRRD